MSAATRFVRVAETADIQEGVPFGTEVAGEPVCIVRVAGELYAFDDRCPHRGAKLSEGWLDGTTLTCKQHTWEYDVTNGALLRLRAPVCLTMRDVRESGGDVEVQA